MKSDSSEWLSVTLLLLLQSSASVSGMKSDSSEWLSVTLLLLLQSSASVSEVLQVVGPAAPVVVSPGEDAVLPCYLSRRESVEDLEISCVSVSPLPWRRSGPAAVQIRGLVPSTCSDLDRQGWKRGDITAPHSGHGQSGAPQCQQLHPSQTGVQHLLLPGEKHTAQGRLGISALHTQRLFPCSLWMDGDSLPNSSCNCSSISTSGDPVEKNGQGGETQCHSCHPRRTGCCEASSYP
ncbi:uncharacterized protein [Lepisosteus oculatus]|uniref:uncharacterized protein isoform X2 n=1 Tax=Lepisosteus oculatus TaxID=7918 RepID=UPI00371D740D